MEADKPIKHKNIRLNNYDYSQTGYYFITICTKDKNEYLCEIKQAINQVNQSNFQIKLTEVGKKITEYINNINTVYSNAKLDYYIIMPNHIHFIVFISSGSTLTLPKIINSFKTITTKAIGFPVWQKNYYEHIIRYEQELYEIRKYIENNPLKWVEDEYYR